MKNIYFVLFFSYFRFGVKYIKKMWFNFLPLSHFRKTKNKKIKKIFFYDYLYLAIRFVHSLLKSKKKNEIYSSLSLS